MVCGVTFCYFSRPTAGLFLPGKVVMPECREKPVPYPPPTGRSRLGLHSGSTTRAGTRYNPLWNSFGCYASGRLHMGPQVALDIEQYGDVRTQLCASGYTLHFRLINKTVCLGEVQIFFLAHWPFSWYIQGHGNSGATVGCLGHITSTFLQRHQGFEVFCSLPKIQRRMTSSLAYASPPDTPLAARDATILWLLPFCYACLV